MSYDLNILCINQSNSSGLPFKSLIEVRNEVDYPNYGRYASIWPFVSSLHGVWYYLGKDEKPWFHAQSIIDADFDKTIERELRPFWISDEDVLSNLSPLILYEEHRRDFEKIVWFLIQQSPDKTILFLARYQGGETEIIEGVLKFEEFIKLLKQSKILFNVCYVISI